MSGVSAAVAAFTAHAPEYTALRRRLVPDLDRFYGTAVEAVALGRDPDRPIRVLDLGAGTGLLAAYVLQRFPTARLELLDGSEAMLAEARQRLGSAVSAVHLGDLAGPLPEGPFDAIVSALAIHHLPGDQPGALIDRARRALVPGGVFVNAEQVRGVTRVLEAAAVARWETECRELGASEEELRAAHDRMRHDHCVDLEQQLTWLRQAGLEPVDCLYRASRFAVCAGWRSRR